MIPILCKVVTVTACVSIVFMGLFMALNKMGPSTSHVVRFAWILITWGAFGVGLAQIFGHDTAPTLVQTVGWLGTGLFLAFDRRDYFVTKPIRATLVKTNDSAN